MARRTTGCVATVAISLLLTLVLPHAASAQTVEDHRFCSDTAPNVVFYLDVTTPYDDADQAALVSGVSQIFDALEDGGRLSIRTIEDTFSNSARLLDMCMPFCADNGFFADLFSKCTEGVVIDQKKKLRTDIKLALANRLASAADLPHSEIVRTIATSAAEEYRAGRQNRFYIFSDMIENSTYLPGSAFLTTPIPALMAKLQADHLIPGLADAKVQVFGFGRSGIPAQRQALSQDRVKRITAFWTAYFQAAGATLSLQQNLETAN